MMRIEKKKTTRRMPWVAGIGGTYLMGVLLFYRTDFHKIRNNNTRRRRRSAIDYNIKRIPMKLYRYVVIQECVYVVNSFCFARLNHRDRNKTLSDCEVSSRSGRSTRARAHTYCYSRRRAFCSTYRREFYIL